MPPVKVDWRISDGGPRDYKCIQSFAHRSASAELLGLTINALFLATGKGKGTADQAGHEVKARQMVDDASQKPSNSHVESVAYLRERALRDAPTGGDASYAASVS
jgi:hypothetical protein